MADLKQLEQELKASREHAHRLEKEIHALQDAEKRVNHAVPLPRTGIDYAFAPHPPADRLREAGVSFVMRYLTGPGKALTRREALTLSDVGVDIVALFESTGRTFESGFSAGQRDAHEAMQALDDLKPQGKPPIIFTVDADASAEGKTRLALEYITGAVHEIEWHRVGLYAGYGPIVAAHAENRCKFLCQTYAWSEGKWCPAAQLRQIQNDVKLLGADVDIDRAVAADFGQFRV